MKKNGFTLAEVLITLAIIGVVATLTLPSLMTNTKEQQYAAALKKGVNTLTEVASLNSATDGFDYNDINGFGTSNAIYDTNGAVSYTVWGIVGSKGNIDKAKSASGKIVFRDGSSLTTASGKTCAVKTDEGITKATPVMFDANGDAAPNKDFTCSATSAAGCNDKSKRIAGDRFYLCLGGTVAYPTTGGDSAQHVAEWILYGANAGSGAS